jgi:hypothetical protein
MASSAPTGGWGILLICNMGLAVPRNLLDTYQRGFFLRYFSHYEELLDNMKRLDLVEVGEEMMEKKL